MTTRRSYSSSRHTAAYAAIALPVSAVGGWADLGEPMHAYGLAALLLPGLVLAMVIPALLLSIHSVPLLLIPSRTRKWWRRGADRSAQRSSYIPRHLRLAVLAADRHRCCFCGTTEGLAIDHIFPWSLGGLTVMWNLAVLCKYHNTVKSNYWQFRSGHHVYVPFKGENVNVNVNNKKLAAEILAFELRHRWNPGRWIRAGWALGT